MKLFCCFSNNQVIPYGTNIIIPYKYKPKENCPICLCTLKSYFNKTMRLKCGHFFHLNCVTDWLIVNPTCPICRTKIIKNRRR